jgi:succinate dehydrogenase / fumarate reductase, cytochrome b subunit
MSRALKFLNSSIGKKIVMAVTGVILSGFILGHMTGNLLVFKSPEAMNHYAAFLQGLGSALWAIRLVLLAAVGLHAWAYLSTMGESLNARPVGYRKTAYETSDLASRTMRWTGPILAVFIVFHILHMTVGSLHPSFKHLDAYGNVVRGLSVVPVAVFYVVAMACLGVHTWHGTWSMLQTLGLSHPRFDPVRKKIAVLFTLVVAGGFLLVPLAVLFGAVR